MWHELNTFLMFLSPTLMSKSRYSKLMLREYAVPLKTPTYDTPQLSGNLACRAHWEAGHCFLDCGSRPDSGKSCQPMPWHRASSSTPFRLPSPCLGVCTCYSCARNTLPTDSSHLLIHSNHFWVNSTDEWVDDNCFLQSSFLKSTLFHIIAKKKKKLEPENWNEEFSIIIKSNPCILNLKKQTQRGEMPSPSHPIITNANSYWCWGPGAVLSASHTFSHLVPITTL